MSLNLRKKNNSQVKRIYAPNIISQINNNNMKNIHDKYINTFKYEFFPNKKSIHPKALTPNHYGAKKYFLSKEMNLLPPKSPEYLNKKTLLLDLDETLVHASFISFPKNDIVLNVNFDGTFYKIYVLVRPGAEEFIKNISQYYELVIFTASLSKYASPLLDLLDKEKKIQHRLYRESCTLLNGVYIKSLKKIGRNMKDLIIVDNSPLAYAFDRDNGLPISSWFGEKSDKELSNIMPLLIFLSKTNDVRKFTEKFVFFDKIDYSIAYKIIKKEENFEKLGIMNNNNNYVLNKEQNNILENNINTKNKDENKKKGDENLIDNNNICNNNISNNLIFNKDNNKNNDNDIKNNCKKNFPFLMNKSKSYKTKLYQNININHLEMVNSTKNKKDINKDKDKDEKKFNFINNKQNNLTSKNNNFKKKNSNLFLNLTQRSIKDNNVSKNKKKLTLTKGLTLGISNTCKNIFVNQKSNNYNNNNLIRNYNLYKKNKNHSNINIFNKSNFYKSNKNNNENSNNNNIRTMYHNNIKLNFKDLLNQYNNNNFLNKRTKNRFSSSFRNKPIFASDCKSKMKKGISSSMSDKEVNSARNSINQIINNYNNNNRIKSGAGFNMIKNMNYKITTEFNINNNSLKNNIVANNITYNNI